jgi:uncharacterized protein YndB with AHSA1/START domain
VRLDVQYEEVLPYPIEAVWSELTSAAAISDWLMATDDFEPSVGCRFRMTTQRLSPTGFVDAEVLEIARPHRMVWSWSSNDGNPPSTVSFELAEVPEGTRLRLRHTGDLEASVARELREGWPGRIDALADVIRRTASSG